MFILIEDEAGVSRVRKKTLIEKVDPVTQGKGRSIVKFSNPQKNHPLRVNDSVEDFFSRHLEPKK